MAKAKRRGGAGVIITGDVELAKALAEFEPKVQKALTRKATRAAAKLVLESAKARVPVLTGELESSLKVRAMKKRKGQRRGKKFGHSVVTGEGFFVGDQFYGGFLELGTKERYLKKSGKSVGRIPAGEHDFLRPALYDNKVAIRAIFNRVMRQVVSEARMKKRPAA